MQLVIADAHAGLTKAVRHHLPEAPLQRCCVHLQRNIVGKAPQKLRARLAKAVWQVSRVFPMHGRKEIEPDAERIIFYENPRDPAVSAALHDACARLNDRKLSRGGRRLTYSIEEPPLTGRSG